MQMYCTPAMRFRQGEAHVRAHMGTETLPLLSERPERSTQRRGTMIKIWSHREYILDEDFYCRWEESSLFEGDLEIDPETEVAWYYETRKRIPDTCLYLKYSNENSGAITLTKEVYQAIKAHSRIAQKYDSGNGNRHWRGVIAKERINVTH